MECTQASDDDLDEMVSRVTQLLPLHNQHELSTIWFIPWMVVSSLIIHALLLQMTNELKEIDMEDSEEEVAPDIDSCDVGNSLAVVEYVDEIYSFYRRSEVIIILEPPGEVIY
jgi:hypothetical protein